MMRDRFNTQLMELNRMLTDMGKLCEDAISGAASLLDGDGDLQEKERLVLQSDAKIDRMERDIETLCLRLLLMQQPVAGDLRQVSASLKMVSDMERIGDQAGDIAELSEYIRGKTPPQLLHLNRMAKESILMVNRAVDSFVRRDLALARSVIRYDDVVDDLFRVVKEHLISMIQQDGSNAEMYIDILMIAKYLERIGDHATNIAEWVEYSITGVHSSAELENETGI